MSLAQYLKNIKCANIQLFKNPFWAIKNRPSFVVFVILKILTSGGMPDMSGGMPGGAQGGDNGAASGGPTIEEVD